MILDGGSRRFNKGGDNDSDYVRIVPPSSVAPNDVTIAACFARELDDGNFQTIAQFSQAGVDTSRQLIGIPSTSDVFRAASGDTAGTFRSANTVGALTNEKFYVGVGRFISSTSRTAQRTGAASGSNSQSSIPGNFDEMLIARKGLTAFESFPGWLQWVAFWRIAVNAADSTELCEYWADPRRIRPEALLAFVDMSDKKAVLFQPKNEALLQIVTGDPFWSTFGPYPIRTRRRRIFVPAGGGGNITTLIVNDALTPTDGFLSSAHFNRADADLTIIADGSPLSSILRQALASDSAAVSDDPLSSILRQLITSDSIEVSDGHSSGVLRNFISDDALITEDTVISSFVNYVIINMVVSDALVVSWDALATMVRNRVGDDGTEVVDSRLSDLLRIVIASDALSVVDAVAAVFVSGESSLFNGVVLVGADETNIQLGADSFIVTGSDGFIDIGGTLH